ncbi:cell wall-binding repeat-containing protein [Leifsonia sp. NPDC080035]|uniref:Cell wall-binding repeat-containing protein n=1 Tax=Leifsonia sp. NPDC080035 TaxID=3143936 RepID=A0AAU7GAU9_9MICO
MPFSRTRARSRTSERSRLWPARAGVSAGLAVLLSAGAIVAAAPATAATADLTVPDPQLRACINVTMLNAAADAPISQAQLAALPSNRTLSCGSYPGIASFEGLQYAPLRSLTFRDVTITDLSPLGAMSGLSTLNVQSYSTPDGALDLAPLAGAADTLAALNLNVSTNAGSTPTTELTGLGAFTNLTTLSLSNNQLSSVPGLSSLTKLTALYLAYNNFGNDIIAQLPSATFSILNVGANHINDFTGLPSATTLTLGAQRVVGTDVLLASADQDSFSANPSDRPVPFAGASVLRTAGAADTADIEFNTADLFSAADAGSAYWPSAALPAGFDTFAYYGWHLDKGSSGTGSAGESYTLYPTAVVNLADRGVTLPYDAAATVEPLAITYSVSDPSVPTFTPTGFAIQSGTLPEGISLDAKTGALAGTTTDTGTFSVKVAATDASGLTVAGTFTLTVDAPAVDWTRLAGADRYETAAAIAEHAHPQGAKTVYVATGMNFPDALSAGPVAAQEDAPIVLTRTSSLPAASLAAIQKLKPSTIVVVGGTGAVGKAVAEQLADLPSVTTVKRVGGIDRFETSRLLAQRGFGDGVDTAFVATGLDYPDALSASAPAGDQSAPILLVRGTSSAVDAATTAELTKLGVKTTYVVGGTGVVTQGVQNGLPGASRLAGADRYATNLAVAEKFYPTAKNIFVATGLDFPDALVGGVLAATDGGPLLLAKKTAWPNATLAYAQGLGFQHGYLFGGTGVLSDALTAMSDTF